MGVSPVLRHHSMSRYDVLGACLVMAALIPMSPLIGDAQIVTNITSSGLKTQVDPPVGNAHTYTIIGGTRPGGSSNLFHSFGSFNVGPGDTANFFNDSGLATSNIISRVTGGNISNIYGTIQIDQSFGSANLFLMNPSGIVLGPGASLNVGGSVSFTTADYLQLFDGANSANFYANPANDGLANSILAVTPSAFEFLSASPAAYGFLTAPDPSATITVQGSHLNVSEGHSLSLVGGDITIQSGMLDDGTIQAANLQAPGGQINLVSEASPGAALASTFQPSANIDGTSFTTMGTVTLKEGTVLNVSGQLDESGAPIGNGNSGTVLVHGGRLVMETSAILAVTVGTMDGAPTAVDIQASQDVALSNGATIVSATIESGRGGDVVIETPSVALSDFSSVLTSTSAPGSGGEVVLNVGRLHLLNGSNISSSSTGNDLDGDGVTDIFGGVGGTIAIQGLRGRGSAADSVTLSGGSGIASEAFAGSAGGGEISITATSVTLKETSLIKSSTNATAIDLNGDGVIDLTGRGGDLVLNVQRLHADSGATITSKTGVPTKDASDSGTITVQGRAGSGSQADFVVLTGQGSSITSDSNFNQAGEISIHAGTLTINDGATISAGSLFSTGSAGTVTLTANSILIAADGQIVSRSFAQDSGQVTITAKEVTLNHGSIVTNTSSESGGRGGDVVIHGGTVTLTNGARITSESEASSTGRAGDITIRAESLALANQSEISSSSKGTVPGSGDAGNISIQSNSTVRLNNSSITTEATAASGGRIIITAPDMIQLVSSHVSTSVKDGTGGGGNITIDPDFVILKDSQILAQAFAGNGGAIDITAGLFLADASSLVDASSTQGVSGTVEINAPINNLSEVIARLPESLIEVQALLRAACAARLEQGGTSSFVERGRDSIPAGPEGLLASPYLPMVSGHVFQWPATPSHELSGIQLRRLSGGEFPTPVMIRSDHTACSS